MSLPDTNGESPRTRGPGLLFEMCSSESKRGHHGDDTSTGKHGGHG